MNTLRHTSLSDTMLSSTVSCTPLSSWMHSSTTSLPMGTRHSVLGTTS